ncbi:hypothetical protein J3S89_13515 [Pinisolibacter sp. B13]|uniref:serine O-acetyltransferase n=1 Tax=Pinisolibacter aquiterrae TaxID=2815579 RepID=UPI001C3D9009|nr:hypothetical protein [Pinisolibacter aquiterrae]MBV5265067.1 hypothetical protein [Pinisolibacter aquiterrae]
MSMMESELQLALPMERIVTLLARQLGNLFEFHSSERGALEEAIESSVPSMADCFRACRNKYYSRDGSAYFNPFHSGQYVIFLYFVSHHLSLHGHTSLADRVYYLNKALNGLDIFHGVEMPWAFFLDHPVGAVIGRAEIGAGFTFCQNCTVGSSRGVFPVIEREVTLFAGAMVIGRSRIGRCTVIGAGTQVVDRDIPPYSVVNGSRDDLVVRTISPESFEKRSFFHTSVLDAHE